MLRYHLLRYHTIVIINRKGKQNILRICGARFIITIVQVCFKISVSVLLLEGTWFRIGAELQNIQTKD